MPVLEYSCGRIVAKLRNTEKILADHVSFSLDSRQSMALIGETGSGKTMIARSIMKLLPANVRMCDSSIVFCGRELLSVRSLRKLLGVEIVYIPQNGLEFLNPSRKVKHHLYDNLKKMGVRGAELYQTALEKLAGAGFESPEEIMEKYPFQLSGGMAQRVTIAISACSRAKLVIADEPTNGLDYAAKVNFMQTLNELFPEAARLIITHDIAVAELCEQTMVLCGGRMMEKGPSAEVLRSPHQPYTKALIDSLVKNGMKETPVLRKENGFCPFYKRCSCAQPVCQSEWKCSTSGEVEWWCNHTV